MRTYVEKAYREMKSFKNSSCIPQLQQYWKIFAGFTGRHCSRLCTTLAPIFNFHFYLLKFSLQLSLSLLRLIFYVVPRTFGHKNGVWRRVRHHITVVGLRHHICHSIFLCRHRRQFCRFCLDALPFYCLPPYNSPFPVNTNTIAIELCYTLLVTKCNSQHKVCC